MQQIRFPQNEFQSFEAPMRAEIDIRALEVVQGKVPEHLDGGFYRLLGDRQWPSFIENDIGLLNEDDMASCLRISNGRVDFRTRYCRWLTAGVRAELAFYPDAHHTFIETPHPAAGAANARIDRFLVQSLESR